MGRKLLWIALFLLPATLLAAEPMNLDDPEDAVRAMRKLQCHLEDGKPAIYWWTGTTYSRVPGEKDRLLFKYEGMNIRACATIGNRRTPAGGCSASQPRYGR